VADNYHQLYDDVRRAAGYWTYPELAQLTGESLRTLQRHGGISTGEGMKKLILAAHAKDPDLARRFAVVAGRNLEELGIAPPKPAPAPPVSPKLVAEQLRQQADSVLLAAAHAAGLPPEAVRPQVAAALARVRDIGASPADLAAHLAKPLPGASKA
jgi:hypothetical protein